MRINKGLFIASFLALITYLDSCEEPTCREEVQNPPVQIGYFVTNDSRQNPLNVNIQSIIGLNQNRDTIDVPYFSNINSSEVNIIPDENYIALEIRYNEIQLVNYDEFGNAVDTNLVTNFSETLNIEYTVDVEMVSPECGFVNSFFLEDIKCIPSISDSCVIINPLISHKQTTSNEDIFYHIAVYF